MKNLLFGIAATVLFVCSGKAQEKIDFDQKAEFKSATVKFKTSEDSSSYSYKSLSEFNEGADDLFNQINFEESQQNKAEKCEVTVEVSVTVNVGAASITMSGSVTTTCANAAAAAKKLKRDLIAAALG